MSSKTEQSKPNQEPKPNQDLEDEEFETEEELETETEEEEEEDVDSDDQAADDPAERIAQLTEELAELRIRLRRANKQAAERRIKLRELTGKKKDNEDESEESVALATQLNVAQRKLRKYELATSVNETLDTLDLSFTSARARNDVVDFALAEIEREFVEPDDKPDAEDFEEAVRKVIKKRPYLLRAKKEAPQTDSKKRGKSDTLPIKEEDLATQFGIKPL